MSSWVVGGAMFGWRNRIKTLAGEVRKLCVMDRREISPFLLKADGVGGSVWMGIGVIRVYYRKVG